MNSTQQQIDVLMKQIHEELKKSSIDHKEVAKLVVQLKQVKKLHQQKKPTL